MPAEPDPLVPPDAVVGASPRRAKLNAAGEERPAFLLEFPADPELEVLIAAFEAGNFAQVRRDAPRLASRTVDATVRRAALELRTRTEPDPLLLALLGMCIALFVFLVIWVYMR